MTPGRATRSAVLALALAALASGCSTRARDNPLDPRNRATHGMLTGFNALAADGVVELRWPLLTQEGVEGYHVQRWRPGATPLLLPGAAFPSYVGATEDFDVANDSTYVYRLVALFATGDSAVSPPDTATPGTIRVAALTADPAGFAALTPDLRDLFYTISTKAAYDDVALDRNRGWFWLSSFGRGLIERRRFNGTIVGPQIPVDGPDALTVTTGRGIVWAARLHGEQVVSYTSDTLAVDPNFTIYLTNLEPTAVDADNGDGSVWVGTSSGLLEQVAASTGITSRVWQLPGGIVALATDESYHGAWVAVHDADLFDLYYVAAVETDAGPPVREGLLDVIDLAVDPLTHSVWVSERGSANAGNGRLTRIATGGQIEATLGGIEPYGLALLSGSSDCWVTDLRSNRVLEVSPAGVVVRRSITMGLPYRVVVYRP